MFVPLSKERAVRLSISHTVLKDAARHVDTRCGMSSALTLREQDMLAETLQRERTPFRGRDRVAEGIVTGAFLAAAIALLVAAPPGAPDLWPAAVCIAVLALATRVPFHVASGFTVPTQLAFVPLLFAVPPALVPPAVVVALALARCRR